MSTDASRPLPLDRVSVPTGDAFRTAVTRPLTALAFWLAVVLPFLHIPLLATGLNTASAATAFAGLVGLNVVSLVVGRYHHSMVQD